jgi:hypothetical protein
MQLYSDSAPVQEGGLVQPILDPVEDLKEDQQHAWMNQQVDVLA